MSLFLGYLLIFLGLIANHFERPKLYVPFMTVADYNCIIISLASASLTRLGNCTWGTVSVVFLDVCSVGIVLQCPGVL